MSSALIQPCAATSAAADPPPREGVHGTAVLLATILGSSLAFIDGSVVNVALTSIQRSLQANGADISWLINAYLLPLSALVLLGGGAGDRFGRRRLFIIGTVLFAAASLACALAPNLELLLAARAVQGVGAALVMPSSLALIGASFEGEARGRAIGVWAAAGAIAGAGGPLLGGWLVDAVGWRAIFLINLPIAAGAVLLAWRGVRESHDHSTGAPLDWGGAALATVGLGAMTWGLTALGKGGAAAPAAAVAGALLLVGFVAFERRRGERAMMPLSLFGARTFVGVTLLTFCLYAALGGLLVLLPYVLIRNGGYSATAAGAALLPFPLIMGSASRSAGRLAARIGARLPLTLGPVAVAVGFLLFTRVGLGHAPYWTVVLPALLVLAAGMALSVAPLTTTVMTSVDVDHAGSASGVNNAVARTAGLVATALLGLVFTSGDRASFVAQFRLAALVGAGLAGLAALSAFLLVERRAGPKA